MAQVIAGHYVMSEQIGSGGMGTVYRGTDTRTRQIVAVKRLKSDLAKPDLLERFRREGEALRTLNHPNIVKLLDAVEEAGSHYLIIEYVSGGDLTGLLKRGRLETEQILQLSIDLADALTRAHRLNIIHRDLKPANVLLAEDGTLKLTDFGVAHVAGKQGVTEADTIVGTIDYLAPEVLNGNPQDARADIWAFGVMLFEMLTGQRPFVGHTFTEIITRIATAPIPDLEALRPDAPIALIDLIYRMLERDKLARIASVRHVGAALEDILQHRDIGIRADKRFETPTPDSTDVIWHNLPAQTTPFVGREHELTELARLLHDSTARLVTITAPGGMGKTRLGLEAAERELSHFANGVYFVELAPLSDVNSLVPAIADATGYQFQTDGREPKQQLLDYLHVKHRLLVMDNFEHLLEGAGIVSDILKAAPHVKILATSRQRLNQPGETLFHLSGMDFPAWETPADALEYAAVKLFLQSARRVQPQFEVTADNMDAIARICKQVQGMPLGIVLAAAWLAALSPNEIAAEIARSIDFLEAEGGEVPERQRSIRAVFDYSWQMMTPDEQQVFMKLSVFRGGFTREAAETVAGASLRVLLSLMNKSLIHRNAESGRYDIHELMRQYADDKFVASGEAEQWQNAHLDFFLSLARQARPKLEGIDQGVWLRRLDQEHHNLRVALRWSVVGGGVEPGLQLGASLWLFWFMRGYLVEGRQHLAELLALARGATPASRADALDKAGVLARYEGDYARAHSLINDGLTIYRELRNKQGIADLLANLGFVTLHQDNYTLARSLYEESLSINRELKNGQGIADSLSHLGLVAFFEGDYASARSFDEESLAIWRTLSDRQGIAWSLHRLGNVTFSTGDYERARALFAESLAISKDMGFQWGLAWSLEDFARLALGQRDYERALHLAGAATRLRKAISIPLPTPEWDELKQRLDFAWQTLGDDTAGAAWERGKTLNLDTLIQQLQDEMPGDKS